VPLYLGADAIASNPRLIVDDRNPPSRDPIEQRRFPYIRASNYGNESWHPFNMGEAGAFVNG